MKGILRGAIHLLRAHAGPQHPQIKSIFRRQDPPNQTRKSKETKTHQRAKDPNPPISSSSPTASPHRPSRPQPPGPLCGRHSPPGSSQQKLSRPSSPPKAQYLCPPGKYSTRTGKRSTRMRTPKRESKRDETPAPLPCPPQLDLPTPGPRRRQSKREKTARAGAMDEPSLRIRAKKTEYNTI